MNAVSKSGVSPEFLKRLGMVVIVAGSLLILFGLTQIFGLIESSTMSGMEAIELIAFSLLVTMAGTAVVGGVQLRMGRKLHFTFLFLVIFQLSAFFVLVL